MDYLYNRILELCKANNISVTQMCKEAGISRSTMTELKKGRSNSLSQKTLGKISEYFNVKIDYLLGIHESEAETEKQNEEARLRLALFGGNEEVTDEMWDEAMFAIELIKQRHARKKETTNGETAADGKEQ